MRFLYLLTLLIFSGLISYGDNSISSETTSVTVPIRKDGGNEIPNKHAPSVVMSAYVLIYGDQVYFEFPFKDYPLQVEIELETTPYGYWSATMVNEQSYLDGFDGTSGDYKLNIVTADGSSYIGYFSLE